MITNFKEYYNALQTIFQMDTESKDFYELCNAISEFENNSLPTSVDNFIAQVQDDFNR